MLCNLVSLKSNTVRHIERLKTLARSFVKLCRASGGYEATYVCRGLIQLVASSDAVLLQLVLVLV